MNDLALDFDRQSFSRRGAWLKLNFSSATPHRLHIRTLRKQATALKEHPGWAHDCYELALYCDGEELVYETEAFASHLQLRFPGGEATVLFTDELTLAVYAKGAEVRWQSLQEARWYFMPAQNELLLSAALAQTAHHFMAGEGSLAVESESVGSLGTAGHSVKAIIIHPDAEGRVSCAFRETLVQEKVPPLLPAFDKALATARADVAEWQSKRPQVPDHLQDSVQSAWQLMGSFQVSPSRSLTRQTLYCSKNSWLTKIWTWDNCFHALGLAHHSAALAFDQLLVVLDQQAEHGELPDSVSDLKAHFGCVKPPVYGWTVRELVGMLGLEACRPWFAELLPRLEKLTDYWLTYHRHAEDASSLCFYRHGNDSGWDNATVFDDHTLVRSPDLDAYLVLQMDVIADLARDLGQTEKAASWQARSEAHLEAFLRDMVVDNRFVARRVPDGQIVDNSASCGLRLIPILLGKRLPEAVQKNLVQDLQPDGPFFTACGIASEAVTSPHYESDGYWRGPAWAPVQMQVYAGLRDLGETELARELLTRTTNMWAKHPSFSEHHDALTGAARKAPGVMWTAAAHVWFSAMLGERRSRG